MKIDRSSLKNVLNNLSEYQRKTLFAIDQTAAVSVQHMENYAKNNARWNDQTGMARKGLTGYSTWVNPFLLQLGVFHTMPYGLWLELAHGREYAILEEARDVFIKQFLDEVKKVIK